MKTPPDQDPCGCCRSSKPQSAFEGLKLLIADLERRKAADQSSLAYASPEQPTDTFDNQHAIAPILLAAINPTASGSPHPHTE